MTSSSNVQHPRLTLPVRLIFFERSISGDTCAATRRALEQIVESSEGAVTLETVNLSLDKERAADHGVDRVPALIAAASGFDRIRYYGAPLGRELPTLMEAIAMIAASETPLTDDSRARLHAVSTPVHIQVFFTPGCVYCPQMISLANRLAVANRLISASAIDATGFPDLVRRYAVNGVPKTVINDRIEIMGAVSEGELVTAVVSAAE